jgi:sporulation-control protein spo0M
VRGRAEFFIGSRYARLCCKRGIGVGIREGGDDAMSFAKRLLSSVGIGAAVDTRLDKKEFEPGEEVQGVEGVKGGGTEQKVEGLYLYMQTYFKRESGAPR